MRHICRCMGLAVLSGIFFISMAYSSSQEEVIIETQGIYAPRGFDSNDNYVEVVVTGEVPNTCYLRPRGKVEIVGNKIIITMTATRVFGDDVSCIMAIVPYMVSVPLGQIPEGHYDIYVNTGVASEKKSTIEIEQPSSNSINNFSYANVTHITTKPTGQKIVLEGVHPSSCMEIDRVEIVINEKRDTYSVLPILKQISAACDQSIKPFSFEIILPLQKAREKVVIHIRKMDGTGLNYLFESSGKIKSISKP